MGCEPYYGSKKKAIKLSKSYVYTICRVCICISTHLYVYMYVCVWMCILTYSHHFIFIIIFLPATTGNLTLLFMPLDSPISPLRLSSLYIRQIIHIFYSTLPHLPYTWTLQWCSISADVRSKWPWPAILRVFALQCNNCK